MIFSNFICCLFIFYRWQIIHIFNRLFDYLIQVWVFWQSFFHCFMRKYSFFNYLNFCLSANAFPLLTALKNMSTLNFLFKSNIFLLLNSFWSRFEVFFFDLFFHSQLPYKKIPFCLKYISWTTLGNHMLSMGKSQQTIENIWGRLSIFPKILSYPRQCVSTEKDSQSYRK